jgi:hypothetical protein
MHLEAVEKSRKLISGIYDICWGERGRIASVRRP